MAFLGPLYEFVAGEALQARFSTHGAVASIPARLNEYN